MGQYALRRLRLFISTLQIATFLVFALFWIAWDDPAPTILVAGEGDSASVPAEQLQKLRGDLGTALCYKTPLWEQLKDRFLVMTELAALAILLIFRAAVPLGVTAAVKQDGVFDYASRVISTMGIALPTC